MRGSTSASGDRRVETSDWPERPCTRPSPAMNGFAKAWEKVAEGDYGGAFKSVKQQVKKVRSRLPLPPFWTVSVVVVTVIDNPPCFFSGRAGHDGSRGRRGGGHEL